MSPALSAFPRRTLAIPGILGIALCALALSAGPSLFEFMTPSLAALLLLTFVAVTLIELFAVPAALWRLVTRPELRVAQNVLCMALGVAFLGILIAQLLAHYA